MASFRHAISGIWCRPNSPIPASARGGQHGRAPRTERAGGGASPADAQAGPGRRRSRGRRPRCPGTRASGGREIPHRQGPRAREAEGEPGRAVRLSPGGAAERAARHGRGRARGGRAQAQHRGLQHPLPAHGLSGGLPARAAGVLLPVPPDPLRPRAERLDHRGPGAQTAPPRPTQREARRRLSQSAWTGSSTATGTTSGPASASEVAREHRERTRRAAQPQGGPRRRGRRRGRPRRLRPHGG